MNEVTNGAGKQRKPGDPVTKYKKGGKPRPKGKVGC